MVRMERPGEVVVFVFVFAIVGFAIATAGTVVLFQVAANVIQKNGFRFRLRTLLIALTVMAVLLGMIAATALRGS
jgi:hypothetical protein